MGAKKLFEALFDRSGEKIKVLAKVVFIVGVVASLVFAVIMFVNCSDDYYRPDDQSMYCGLGFAGLIGGTVVSWIIALFINGFGEIVSGQISLREHLEGKVRPEAADDDGDGIETYICPSCGDTVEQGSDKCESCGQVFEWDD